MIELCISGLAQLLTCVVKHPAGPQVRAAICHWRLVTRCIQGPQIPEDLSSATLLSLSYLRSGTSKPMHAVEWRDHETGASHPPSLPAPDHQQPLGMQPLGCETRVVCELGV